MADRERRGMLIKNNGSEDVRVNMSSRQLHLQPGEQKVVTPEEVRDPTLRRALQKRSISIVRPATQAEEDRLQQHLSQQSGDS